MDHQVRPALGGRSRRALKAELEGRTMRRRHAYEVYVSAPPERVWQAITDPEMTRRY
jgi:hypothetical protein